LHFGHLSVEEPFFSGLRIEPHFGQKSIVFTLQRFIAKMILMDYDCKEANTSINVPF
jgi:hypothetical protein